MNLLKMMTCAAVGTALLGVLPAAQAQSPVPSRVILLPTTGTKEVNVSGNLSLDRDKVYDLGGTYGVFTSPNFEVGGTAEIKGANHTKTLTTAGIIGNYYFRGNDNNPLLPYVGLFGGYTHYDDSALSGGAQAGVKYFLNPDVAVTAQYQYRSTRHGTGTNQIVLGFSTFFR